MIERFRGFDAPLSLDFDASAVLLAGANGTGKTSLFDAIQWLLLDSVPRLKSHRMHRNEEFLVNRWRPRELAVVEAEWRLGGQAVVARRTGTSESSLLEVVAEGQTYRDAAGAQKLEDLLVHGELPLEEMLLTSGLLQQDDLRALLTTKPQERYRRILRLLGLRVLERFDVYAANRLRDARKDLKDRRMALEKQQRTVQSMLEELETLQSQVETGPAASAFAEAIVSVLDGSELLSLAQSPQTLEDAAAIGGAARSLFDQVSRVLSSLSALPDEVPVDPSQELETVQGERRRIQDAITQAVQTLDDAEIAVREAESVHDLVGRLAAAALPMLDTAAKQTPCPVCGTLISPSLVAETLALRSQDAAALVAATTASESAGQAVRQLQAQLAAESAIENPLLQAAADRRRMAADLRRGLLELSSLIRPVNESPLGINPGALPQLPPISDSAYGDAQLLSWWTERGSNTVVVPIRAVAAELNRVAHTAETASAAAAAVKLAAERSAALPRREVQYREELLRLQELVDEEAAASREQGAAASLVERTQVAVTELFRERFDALAPLVNDIYARLDPHPAFKQLSLLVETFRAQGTATASVMDEEKNVRANPMLVFSSAQTNAVVLALFLALAWAAGDGGLPFILLDDPLQAMDDVNALGMADLCRRLRRQRQLVLATHEQRFASLLERKLVGRAEGEDLIVHAFVGWTRAGPTIESRRISPQFSDSAIQVLAS
jgi:DNA repair exonuclease SbcCD ATPase subunit